MKTETLNIILFAVVVYLLIQNKNKKTTDENINIIKKMGGAKVCGDLGTTF